METGDFVVLSDLDQLMPRLYVRWLLCFPFQSDSPSKERLIDTLHSGVTATFQDLPILRDSLVPEPQDKSKLKVLRSEEPRIFQIHAIHHDGAEDSTFPTYAHLREANFPVSELPDSTLNPQQLPNLPVFDIMPTFIRGGLLLCIKCHHSVVDGAGLGLIMQTLARNCYAAACLKQTAHDTVPIPSTDRSQLPRAQVRASIDVGFRLQDEYERLSYENRQYAPMTSHIFRFHAAALKKLKLLCTTGTELLTTHDCLTALLYASISYARSLRLSFGSQTQSTVPSILGIAVDGRSRVEPPMHNYCGNLTVYASFSSPIYLPVMEIPLSMFEDTERLAAKLKLAQLSSQTRQAIARVASPQNTYIASTIGLAQSVKDVSLLKPSFSNFFQGTDFFISSLAGVPVFKDEWWPGGFVEELRIPLKAHWDGSCVVLPAKDRSARLDILMGSRKDDMEVVKRILFAFGASITPLDTKRI